MSARVTSVQPAVGPMTKSKFAWKFLQRIENKLHPGRRKVKRLVCGLKGVSSSVAQSSQRCSGRFWQVVGGQEVGGVEEAGGLNFRPPAAPLPATS